MSAEPQETKAAPPAGAQLFDNIAQSYEHSTGGSTRAIARQILELESLRNLFDAPHDAVVLDNACGTGIVAEEIINRCRRQSSGGVGGVGGVVPEIRAADPVEKMVAACAAKFSSLGVTDRCSAAVMPGERLTFADGTFSHSITNMGLMFYTDAAVGARELHRTLRPGGVAVVTTWAQLGQVDDILYPAQQRARPGAELIKMPIEPRWFDPAQLLELFGMFSKTWTEEEKASFGQAVRSLTPTVTVPCTQVDGSSGYGVPVTAIVVICTK
ncbi:Ubiquinone/menaquinone biosynthesis C-methyltransferase UbiE [Beauveria bassiana]|nr:Ubiquinone/menaquinone biosynthesis C-methyltransferase UbiE [Beauveria bassiana]